MREYRDQCLRDKEMLFKAVLSEHRKQIKKWGYQSHSLFVWLTYTAEEMGELAEAISENEYRNGNKANIAKEAIQVATLALKIAEMVGGNP